jgi:hypothetical protein
MPHLIATYEPQRNHRKKPDIGTLALLDAVKKRYPCVEAVFITARVGYGANLVCTFQKSHYLPNM